MCVCFGFKYSFMDNVKMKLMSLEESWGAYNAGMLLGEGGSKETASWHKSV